MLPLLSLRDPEEHPKLPPRTAVIQGCRVQEVIYVVLLTMNPNSGARVHRDARREHPVQYGARPEP